MGRNKAVALAATAIVLYLVLAMVLTEVVFTRFIRSVQALPTPTPGASTPSSDTSGPVVPPQSPGASVAPDQVPDLASTQAQGAKGATTAKQAGGAPYLVLGKAGVPVTTVIADVQKTGATVLSANRAVGLLSVTSADTGFAAKARALPTVAGVANEASIGSVPASAPVRGPVAPARTATAASATADPLDSRLWGMTMINAPQAHQTEKGDKRVKVGVIDTGIQGDHPDIAPNFDAALSRNFTVDIEAEDGPCEDPSCVDPVGRDDGGHGTHVAGTIAAATNGMGVTGVAPGVGLVNLKAGQDGGFFFLAPVVNAITYAGDAGIDVVNMSFYVDPWLFQCKGGASGDSPEEAAGQTLSVEAMSRALTYAHSKGVTLVSALGNESMDLGDPGDDDTSPNYPRGNEKPRQIDPAACISMPTEGPFVIGVSAVGPSKGLSDFSNFTSKVDSGEIEVAAPGGNLRDGTPSMDNLILSSVPTHVLQAEGSVDDRLNVTQAGKDAGIVKACTDKPAAGAQKCGFYQPNQGTSMASPHAAGVAALIVSKFGKDQPGGGFGMAPDDVRAKLLSSASDQACPAASGGATCTGPKTMNGFYGEGIVNAAAAVK